jgi:hypothetical protein
VANALAYCATELIITTERVEVTYRENTLAYYDVHIIIMSYYSLHVTTLLFLLR